MSPSVYTVAIFVRIGLVFCICYIMCASQRHACLFTAMRKQVRLFDIWTRMVDKQVVGVCQTNLKRGGNEFKLSLCLLPSFTAYH